MLGREYIIKEGYYILIIISSNIQFSVITDVPTSVHIYQGISIWMLMQHESAIMLYQLCLILVTCPGCTQQGIHQRSPYCSFKYFEIVQQDCDSKSTRSLVDYIIMQYIIFLFKHKIEIRPTIFFNILPCPYTSGFIWVITTYQQLDNIVNFSARMKP